MESIKDFYHNNDLADKKYQVSYWTVPKYFSKNNTDYPHVFTGTVENFNPTGNCVFWNEDKKEILVVDYNYISVMRAIRP
jgi:hypothetical protein